VLGSERLTGTRLDRLTHSIDILEMNGDSYRLKQSRRKRNSIRRTLEVISPAIPQQHSHLLAYFYSVPLTGFCAAFDRTAFRLHPIVETLAIFQAGLGADKRIPACPCHNVVRSVCRVCLDSDREKHSFDNQLADCAFLCPSPYAPRNRNCYGVTSFHACADVPLQALISSCTPFAVEAPGTSRQRPLPWPTKL
jgi:hypothetical protein